MAGFRSRVADVLSAIKGSTIEPQSVNTDDASITNGSISSDSSNPTQWSTRGESFGESVIQATSIEVQGDNTAQNLMPNNGGGLYVVRGKISDESAVEIHDLLFAAPGSLKSVSSTNRNFNGTRSYALQNGNLKVTIDDAGDSYYMTTTAIVGNYA